MKPIINSVSTGCATAEKEQSFARAAALSILLSFCAQSCGYVQCSDCADVQQLWILCVTGHSLESGEAWGVIWWVLLQRGSMCATDHTRSD